MTTKWGTASIGPKQAARAFHAVRFANDNGLSLNLMVTIDFTSLGIDNEKAGGFFRDTWARFSRWYAYQRGKGRAFGLSMLTQCTSIPTAALVTPTG